MKQLLHASIFIFTFCFCAFGQKLETPLCPTVSIIAPSEIVTPNESAPYSAVVDSNGNELNIEYVWAVSGSEILEGQRTSKIGVRQVEGVNLTVSVEIRGLPKNCPNTASESSTLHVHYTPKKIDEFSGSVSKIEKDRSEKISKALIDDPTAQLYVFFSTGKNSSPRSARKRSQEISKLLVRDNGIEAARITMIEIHSNKELTQLWIVPAGSAPPEIQDFYPSI